jgi:hypothetical protein
MKPSTLGSLMRMIGGKSTIAYDKAGEILKVVKQAIADYVPPDPSAPPPIPAQPSTLQNAVASSSRFTASTGTFATLSPNKPSAGNGAKTKSPSRKASGLKRRYKLLPGDVWEDLRMGDGASTVAPVAQAQTVGSSLFGKTLQVMREPPAVLPPKKSVGSSLFGNSLTSSSTAAPSPRLLETNFAEIQAKIHGEIAPPPPALASIPASSASTSAISPPSPPPVQPEMVPFVPAASRNLPAPQPIVSSKPIPKIKEDKVVTVKKSQKKRAASTVENENANGEGTPKKVQKQNATEGESVKKSRGKGKEQERKERVIPVFDYSQEPNLLDAPKAVAKAKAEESKPKVKKVKKGPKARESFIGMCCAGELLLIVVAVVDTSLFRMPPTDKSQPKQGNKSGTFHT